MGALQKKREIAELADEVGPGRGALQRDPHPPLRAAEADGADRGRAQGAGEEPARRGAEPRQPGEGPAQGGRGPGAACASGSARWTREEAQLAHALGGAGARGGEQPRRGGPRPGGPRGAARSACGSWRGELETLKPARGDALRRADRACASRWPPAASAARRRARSWRACSRSASEMAERVQRLRATVREGAARVEELQRADRGDRGRGAGQRARSYRAAAEELEARRARARRGVAPRCASRTRALRELRSQLDELIAGPVADLAQGARARAGAGAPGGGHPRAAPGRSWR